MLTSFPVKRRRVRGAYDGARRAEFDRRVGKRRLPNSQKVDDGPTTILPKPTALSPWSMRGSWQAVHDPPNAWPRGSHPHQDGIGVGDTWRLV